MKKILALALSLLLVLPLAGAVTAEDFDVSDYVHPYTGETYTEHSFDGSGKIFIVLHHGDSIVWRKRTQKDFPYLDIEAVGPDSPLQKDQELRESNPNYREIIWIVLKDKSNRSVIDAVQLLYDKGRCAYATPSPKERPMGDVNGDYKFNLSDVSLTLKHIAGWEGTGIDYYNNLWYADFCYDEKIRLNDVTVMLKLIAGWDENNAYT